MSRGEGSLIHSPTIIVAHFLIQARRVYLTRMRFRAVEGAQLKSRLRPVQMREVQYNSVMPDNLFFFFF
uniref:Uncharacterized protein n=1 Tax=Rhizophora mucronata TaxID=61149 RepID=A0A2P2PX46_RHIMU